MKETIGDIWESGADVICITTNGIVKSSGRLVMGAGIAKDAVDKYSDIDITWGSHVWKYGNIPCITKCDDGQILASFPTKNDWRGKSNIWLVIDSAKYLQRELPENCIVAITRPVCSLGQLKWSNVGPILHKILDDRFTIYNIQ